MCAGKASRVRAFELRSECWEGAREGLGRHPMRKEEKVVSIRGEGCLCCLMECQGREGIGPNEGLAGHGKNQSFI